MCEKCGLLTDELAEEIAVQYAVGILTNDISEDVLKKLQKANKPENFAYRDSFVIRTQKKFSLMLKRHWEHERRLVISHLKKHAQYVVTKDNIDSMLFPQKSMEKELTAAATPILADLMKNYGEVVIDINDFDVPLPIVGTRSAEFLKSYVPKFSNAVETVSVEKIRRELIAGIEAGESIPELTKRVNETFETWNKFRAERIARTESLRSANKAAKIVYKEAGVTKIIWLTWFDDRTCPYCEQLDGQVISIEKNFYEIGDVITATQGGRKISMEITYTNIGEPPLHNLCRCSTAAVIK